MAKLDVPSGRFTVIVVAAVAILSAGTAGAIADGGAGAQVQQDDPGAAGQTVTAEDVSAEEIRMTNVNVSGLTVDLSQFDGTENILEDSFSAAIGNNVQGFEVESIEIGGISEATVTVEDNVATVDAQIEFIALDGVEAEQVTFDGSASAAGAVDGMLTAGSLNAESTTVSELSVGSLTIGSAEAAPPDETPADNDTETPTDNETETPVDNDTEMTSASVTFEDQTSDGTTVVVESVEMSEGGFVAIHNDTLLEGDAVGSVVGVSDYLEPGPHENVTVTLFDVEGANVDESDLTETLIAMPHEDTDDSNQEVYDFVSTDGDADGPYLEDGEAVTDSATVTVETEDETETPVDNETETPIDNETETPVDNETETPIDNETETPIDNETETPIDNETETPVDNETETPVDNETETPVDNETEMLTASVTFSNQTSNGSAVLIESVEMSEGGFVVIHNDTLLEGDAVGSVVGVSDYLEPGPHENVTVTLFDVEGTEVNQSDLTETLIAMPHEDTEDSNQEVYDFVSTNGEADGPYLEDGEAVTDSATVTVETENETSENETAEA